MKPSRTYAIVHVLVVLSLATLACPTLAQTAESTRPANGKNYEVGKALRGAGCDLSCPTDAETYVPYLACDTFRATVTWDPVCTGGGTANCTCTDEHGRTDCTDFVLPTGGDFAPGTYHFQCDAIDSNGQPESCSWDVVVEGKHHYEVEVQLQPKVASNAFTRCIDVELYTACAPSPTVVSRDVTFGPGDSSVTFSFDTWADWYLCANAVDRLHSLKSLDEPDCVDGIYRLRFAGDPAAGGNWLRLGNFAGDTIGPGQADIDRSDLDLLLSEYLRTYDSNGDLVPDGDTPCGTTGLHFDLTGDGLVDALDYSLLISNFAAADQACCGAESNQPPPPPGATAGTDAIDPQLHASQSEIVLNQIVLVELSAFDPIGTTDLAAVDAIIAYDHTKLELIGATGPCDPNQGCGACPRGQHPWLGGFLDDCRLDSLNNPCSGLPDNDGLVEYHALRSPECPAEADAVGLSVVTLEFRSIAGGSATVKLLSDAGDYSHTRAVAVSRPGAATATSLGTPVTINVRSDIVMPPAPVVVDAGNRYVRIDVPPLASVGDAEEVLRVRPITLDHPGAAERVYYVGLPFDAPDENSNQPGLTFRAAPLSCEPVAHAWSSEPTIAIYGAEIMPSSDYVVERSYADCPNFATNELCWSTPAPVTTAKYGDIVAPLDDGPGPNPTQPDLNDISACVDKFLAAPGAPEKYRAQLQPNVVFPNRAINFKDVSVDIGAFLGISYGSVEPGPCTCPSAVACGTPCSSDATCGTGLCIADECRDACGRCAP